MGIVKQDLQDLLKENARDMNHAHGLQFDERK